MLRHAAAALLALGLGPACQASLNADAQMKADLDAPSAEARTDEGEQRALRLASDGTPTEEAVPLLGARHNVQVKSKAGAVACRCVSVLLGDASMTQLAWEGNTPATRSDTQLVIALSPDAECPGAKPGSRGPSYWGYRVQGNDVIVLLEEWGPKPPRTLVAIIPKPPAGGQVYVAPVSKALPYGKALDDQVGRCAIGNPGPERRTGLGDDEIGTSRPAWNESTSSDVAE